MKKPSGENLETEEVKAIKDKYVKMMAAYKTLEEFAKEHGSEVGY